MGLALRGAHGEKSGPEVFRDSIEPGPGTNAIVTGELRTAYAQELYRCLSAGRSFQKLLTSAGSDNEVWNSNSSYIRTIRTSESPIRVATDDD